MKTFKRIAAIAVVTAGFMSASVVFGQGWGRGNHHNGPRYAQQQAQAGPGRVLRDEMFTARIDVLAELAGQEKADIESKIRFKPMWAILDEYKVDYTEFQTKMHEKAGEIVKQAVVDGKISQEQADVMLKRMEEGPHGPRYGMGNKGRRFGKGKGGGRGYWGNNQ